jgi:hypothetical protein
VIFETIQVGRPQSAVGREPLVELGEWLGSDPVQAALRIGPGLDQSCVLEDLQVLGHGRLTEAEVRHELSHGSFAVAEQVEDGLPVGLAEDLERCRLHGYEYVPLAI